ncbi:MAG TPA: hypothetical protein VGG03_24510 [Thermoanaerobaculia bacterium]|jgi:CHAD domain-containing protein
MKELDVFDAAILNVLARVPPEKEERRKELLERLRSNEGKAIARVILAPEGDKVRASKEAHATGAALKRAVRTR